MNPDLPRLRRTATSLTLCLLGLASCKAAEAERDAAYYIRHGEYVRAIELAQEACRERPDDAAAQDTLVRSHIAYHLDRGREALFAGEPETALELFYRALAIDPESPHAITWVRKTRNQLAERWLDEAQSLAGGANLEDEYAAYEKAHSYVLVDEAGEVSARVLEIRKQINLGLSRVIHHMSYRAGRSKSYYESGLRAFREYLLDVARTDFEKSQGYLPSDQARDRQERVEKLLVQERLAQARELEAIGFYFAARNEYRLVLLIDPENEIASEGLDRMDREVRAAQKITEADLDMRRGDFDGAREPLAAAKNLTVRQANVVSRFEADLEDARLRAMYDTARSFERDYLYPQAVEGYARLLEETEFYEDAIARKETVEWLMASAEELYAKAQGSEVEEEAFGYYWEIQNVVWPEYRDVETRLGQLRERGIGYPEEGTETGAPEPKEWKPIRRPARGSRQAGAQRGGDRPRKEDDGR